MKHRTYRMYEQLPDPPLDPPDPEAEEHQRNRRRRMLEEPDMLDDWNWTDEDQSRVDQELQDRSYRANRGRE